MDLDKEFVCAILKEGSDAYKMAIDRGITPDTLFDTGKLGWQFIVDHKKQYGSLPSRELIQGCLADPLGGSLDFTSKLSDSAVALADKVLERRTLNLLKDGAKTLVEKISQRNAKEATEAFQEIYRKLQRESITTSKIESLFSLGREVIEYYDLIKSGAKGIPTPWPTMDDQTMGWWPEDLVLIIGRLSVGKCLDEDTEMIDPVTGIPRSIGEICSDDTVNSTFTWSKERGVHAMPITAKVDTGRKDCLEFVLSNGKTIVVTPEHPFLTPDGWKRADLKNLFLCQKLRLIF